MVISEAIDQNVKRKTLTFQRLEEIIQFIRVFLLVL